MTEEEFSGSSEDTINSEEVKPGKPGRRGKRETPKVRKQAAPASVRVAPKVKLRSLWPSKIIVIESEMPSKTRYIFPQGGSTLDVEPEDAPVLLARRRSAGCCGAGVAEQPFFEYA